MNNVLIGDGGNDTLSGRGGADTMIGGTAATPTLSTTSSMWCRGRASGRCTDSVSVCDRQLRARGGAEVEVLQTASNTGLSLIGNAFSQTIIGGGSADTLTGGSATTRCKATPGPTP